MMPSMGEEKSTNTSIYTHSGFFVVQTKNLLAADSMDRSFEEETWTSHNHSKIMQSQQESPSSQLPYNDCNPNVVCTFNTHSQANQHCDF